MLIGQYLDFDNGDPDYVGLISVNTSPVKVAKQAIDRACMCTGNSAYAPSVSIRGRKI